MAEQREGGAGADSPSGTRLLRLVPLGVNQVPAHPELQSSQTNAPSLSSFVVQCLKEANEEDFITGVQKSGEAKESVEVDGKKHSVVIEKLKKKGVDGDMWFGRRSLHAEVSYEELDEVLRKDHERNEMEYTPAIYDVNTVLEWRVEGEIEGVRDVALRITQMHHAMPAPVLLSDRVFTILLVSFIPTSPAPGTLAQSIDLQLPVDLSSFPTDVKTRSHAVAPVNSSRLVYQTTPSATPFQKKQDGRKLVAGKYVSLEKVARVEKDGQTVSKWEMMTSSDAEGALPMGVQKLGVPGAVVKDVPLAVKYIIAKRGSEMNMQVE